MYAPLLAPGKPGKRSFQVLLLLSFFLVGCGGGPSKAVVQGKVTFKNAPVTGGTITFLGANDQSGGGKIKADGTYSATDVPIGPVKVSVVPLPAGMGATAAPPGTPVIPTTEAEGKPMLLPKKYASPDSSGLNYTIKSKTETLNIDLPG